METYVINYSDGTAMTLKLTDEQYALLCKGFQSGSFGIVIPDVGCMRLVDVRSIIKQMPEAENPSYSGEVTEEEKQYAEYLRKVDEWSAFEEKHQTFDEFVESQRQNFKDEADF